MDQTLTGNATIASGERILHHDEEPQEVEQAAREDTHEDKQEGA